MDKGFLKWLWENNKKTAGVFSAMWAIYTFFTSCKSYFESKDIALTAQVTISWAAALQAVVIFVGMIIIHKSQLRYDSGDHPGKHNYLKFYTCWKGLWFFWLVIYLVLSINIKAQSDGLRTLHTALEILSNLVHNASTVCLFLCFDVLTQARQSPQRKYSIPLLFPITICTVFLALDICCKFYPGLKDVDTSFKLAAVLLILNGVMIAAFVARLDHPAFRTPSWLMLGLYAYGVIQPVIGAAAIFKDKEIFLAGLVLALALKILLLLYVKWLNDTGRLTFLLERCDFQE